MTATAATFRYREFPRWRIAYQIECPHRTMTGTTKHWTKRGAIEMSDAIVTKSWPCPKCDEGVNA